MLSKKKQGRIRLHHFMTRLFRGNQLEVEGHSNVTSAISSEYGDDFAWKDHSRGARRDYAGELTDSVKEKIRRVNKRLKAVVLFRLIYRDIVLYGTSAEVVDWRGRYKPCLHSLMEDRVTSTTCTSQTPRSWFHPLLPGSQFHKHWNVLILVLLALALVYTPLEISFLDNTSFTMDIVMTSIDVCFLTDVLITLNTAYFKFGVLVTSRKAIALNYLKGGLVLDTVSSLPLYLFSVGFSSHALLRYFRIARLVKVFRAARFHKVIKYFNGNEAEQRSLTKALSRIFGAIAVLMLLAHLAACLWYFTATYDDTSLNNWVWQGGFQDQSTPRLYMFSLYWTITVLATVGYGTIHAYSTYEMLFAIAWMLIGALFFSFFLSTMSRVVTDLDLKGERIRYKIDLLHVYCKDLHLSDGFKRIMGKQLQSSMQQSTLDQSQKLELALMLSKPLRLHLGLSIYNGATSRVNFFAHQDKTFIGNIVNMLEYRQIQPEVLIYQRGDYADEIYFMDSGRVSFVVGTRAIPFRTLISGSFFGEIEVIEEKPRDYSAITVTATEVFVLPRKVAIT